MPQETNLNVAPFFDDYSADSNYYKVLFKPGYPVQARELNNLQSILQNQIEDVGNHLFKEGAKVIPGNTTYLSEYSAIQIDSDFLGVPVSLYADQLVGKLLVGEQSGVTAKVENYITENQSERGVFTLYLDYIETGDDQETTIFQDNETLLVQSPIVFATNFIAAGEGCAKAIANEAAATGSAFAVGNGVYFLRGYFVDVAEQVLILDQYTNTSSYRVGFYVDEQIISSDVDPTLTDNAQGFNNFTAPGADRFQITATLQKKDLDDTDDQNFVQIALIQNGLNRDVRRSTDYNRLGDEFARRTFDESGDYYVREFTTTVKNSLEGIGGDGVYTANQITQSGNRPSDDLAIYKISAGKAYVKGYEVDVRSTTFLDVPKPRTTRTEESRAIAFGFGPTFTTNRVHGMPNIGITTSLVVSLRDQRVGSDQNAAAGNEIGVARVYDFALESGSYNASNLNQNQWDISLFDVTPYVDITLAGSVTQSIPTIIEGEQSGATAFLRYPVTAGTAMTAYSVKGTFKSGEKIIFNEDNDTYAFTQKIVNHKISDVQSLFATVGTGITFTADLVPSVQRNIGIASITTGGVVTSPLISNRGTGFVGIATVGDLVSFTQGTQGDINFARVLTSELGQMTIAAVTTVPGVCQGALPSSNITVNDFSILETRKQKVQSGDETDGEAFYSVFQNRNISDVDIENSDLVIRRQFDTTITASNTGTINAGTGEVFLPFDEERYTVIKNDGTVIPITATQLELTAGSTALRFKNLSSNGAARVVATLRKSNIKAKQKVNNRTQSIIIDKSSNPQSGTGGTTLNDGLTYGDFPYGTRVQDNTICLNVPDGTFVQGIFESKDSSDPESPYMTLSQMTGSSASTNDFILGDEMIGEDSGATAIYVRQKSNNSVNFIYLNDDEEFNENEVVQFVKSGATARAGVVEKPSDNITDDYIFFSGQESTFYNFAKIVQVEDPDSTPSNKIIVYFSSGTYNSSDDGDITTVNSYSDYDYSYEIPSVDGIRCSDIIDARPRVSPYTVTQNSRSPLEFYGRDFSAGNHSTTHILASDESMDINSYSYYLGRVDRVYLNKDGQFTVVQGAPDIEPELPDAIDSALNIANVYLPPYLFLPEQAKVSFINYKRYQMNDIAKLEQRIDNLEYYSALNLLESNARELFIPDENGLNKFKSGIFVDDFTTRKSQDNRIGVKNAIWKKAGVLRPSFYCTNLNLKVADNTIAGIGTTTNLNIDPRKAELMGENVKRSNMMVTLDFEEQVWIDQPYATRTESVTPFLVRFWDGSLTLEPTEDVWIDVTTIAAKNIMQEGNFTAIAESIGAEVTTRPDGTRVGVTPVEWESWETTDVRTDVDVDTDISKSTALSWRNGTLQEFNQLRQTQLGRPNRSAPVPRSFRVQEETTTTRTTTSVTTTTSLDQTRTGTQQIVREQIDTQSLGNRIVGRETIQYLRERNIEFTARRMKPYTKLYPFFDSVAIARFTFSKLLRVDSTGSQATFRVGETAVVYQRVGNNFTERARFRVAQLNHKFGPYNAPTDVFTTSPYDKNLQVPVAYTRNTTLLNIDTFTMQSEESDQFDGLIRRNYLIVGATSRATCRVTSTDLVSDKNGTLIGCFFVPPSVGNNPKFETGKAQFRLTSSETDTQIQGQFSTAADAEFFSSGSVDIMQEVTLSVRNARVETRDNFRQNRTLTSSSTSSSTVTDVGKPDLTGVFRDPLAQSFAVDDETGVFLSSVDIYFSQTSDDDLPVTLQIREMELGTPSPRILAFSTVNKRPDEINVSNDSTVATNFQFESPVYLNGLKEYCVVLLSNSTGYRVWISRLGEVDVRTLGAESGQVLVNQQPTLGSLFKSQNASTWTPSQYEDLKFRLNRCKFASKGTVNFVNPELPRKLENLPGRPSISFSKINLVGIGTTISGDAVNDLKRGTKIIQLNSGATAKFGRRVGAAKTEALVVRRAGAGYTPSSGIHTFTGVAFTAFSGVGQDLVGTITIQNGVCIGGSVTSGGFGFRRNDQVTPLAFGTEEVGTGARLGITTVEEPNSFTLGPVQGEFTTNAADILQYVNTAGVTTNLCSSVSAGIAGSVAPTIVTNPYGRQGNEIRIRQRNHGMHQYNNDVILRRFSTDVTPTKLTGAIDATATSTISIANTSEFGVFENVGVSGTTPGYAIIRDEIIEYLGVSTVGLTSVTRGFDNTQVGAYSANTEVQKYEYNGVSLRRINKTHSLLTGENINMLAQGRREADQLGLDYFWLRVDMSQNGVDRSAGNAGGFPELSFGGLKRNKKKGGGSGAKCTYNIPFNRIRPRMNIMTPTLTEVNAFVRTVSGSSVDGTDVAFIDQGYQEVPLDKATRFTTTRLVASKINETNKLATQDLPGNKSFHMMMNLQTADDRLSPCIDLQKTSVRFISNRVNNPIADDDNYEDSPRIKMGLYDQHSYQYVTRNVRLENPATSIKVVCDAYVPLACDIRAMYAVNQDVHPKQTIYTLFPGYGNINSSGGPINPDLNSGLSDEKIQKIDHKTENPALRYYREYSFTINNVDAFDLFRVKLVMTSQDQTFAPFIRNLRVIATA